VGRLGDHVSIFKLRILSRPSGSFKVVGSCFKKCLSGRSGKGRQDDGDMKDWVLWWMGEDLNKERRRLQALFRCIWPRQML
jgi:hypothetical protein